MIELYLDNRKVDMSVDLNVNMTYQQTDLSNPEAKLNSYSKTISLPGTNNNNNIFGHIFRFDNDIQPSDNFVGVNFDPNKRIPFVLLNDGVLYDRGYSQLDKIVVKNNVIDYQLTLYGNIGLFFYNLMYNEDGTEKSLNDLYWGFIVNDQILNSYQENNNVLFEYDKNFIKECWKIRNSFEFDSVNEMNINKFICPVPCYQGYYDDFDSDKVIINTNGLTMNTYDWNNKVITGDILNTKYLNVDGKQDNHYYTYKDSTFLLCELDREVGEFEIGDLRSHYQPYALRMKGIFDTICNPDNNGGFNVNIDNISPIEMKYIENAYIMQDRFSWDDVNKNTSGSTKSMTFNKGTCSAISGSDNAKSETYDLSEYSNPKVSLNIYPEIQPNQYVNHTLKSRANIAGGINSQTLGYGNGGNRTTYNKMLRGAFGNSVQYFYINILDENNNIIKTSDIYLYGDYKYNANDQDSETNVCMLSNTDDWTFHANTDIFSDCSVWSDTIVSILRTQGKKIKRGSDDLSRWSIPSDLIADETDVNAVQINTSHRYNGYKFNEDGNSYGGSFDNFVGEMIKIETSLPKTKVKIQLVSSAVSMINTVKPISTFGYAFPMCYYYEPYPETSKINNNFIVFKPTNGYHLNPEDKYINETRHNYDGKYELDEIQTYYKCHIEGGSSIYDGSIGGGDESHIVNKFSLFMNTNSPYDYLISLGKMFNWKFEVDTFSNDIYIYSFKNYYDNEVVDLSEKIDRNNCTITPTTSTSSNYRCGLEVVESYPQYVWDKVNKSEYGMTKIKTDYQFNKEPKDMLEDVIYKNAVPYRQSSVFFNKPILNAVQNHEYFTPAMGKRVKLTLFNEDDDNVELSLKAALSLDSLERPKQNIESNNVLLGMFDDEYGHIDSTNVICFYDKKSTLNPEPDLEDINVDVYAKPASVMVSDNFPTINQINGNNCYYWTYITNLRVLVDADNGIYGSPSYYEKYPPVFRSYFIDDDVTYFATMKSEKEYSIGGLTDNVNSIYDICWKNYINDLYNKNNKIVNVKIKSNINPYSAMKKFYTFDNAVFVLNKITDYNVNDSFMNCEFIQVQNIKNYIGQ